MNGAAEMVIVHCIATDPQEYEHVLETLAGMWTQGKAEVPKDVCRWLVDWIIPDFRYPDLVESK